MTETNSCTQVVRVGVDSASVCLYSVKRCVSNAVQEFPHFWALQCEVTCDRCRNGTWESFYSDFTLHFTRTYCGVK